MPTRSRSRQGRSSARACSCAARTVASTLSLAREYSSSRHVSLSRKWAYTTVLDTRAVLAMSAVVVAWYPFAAMHVASARRIRPRRGPSSTAGSSAGFTRVCIARNCNGRWPPVTEFTGPSRKVFGPPDVLPKVSMTTTAGPPGAVRPGARAYAVWVVALAAYAVAVFHRSSLGVAAVEAQERFSAGASVVSLFLVLQLAVYAALQVPVGVALDRFGSRRMILAGAVTMAAGQLVLALASDVPTALAARVFVGAGDAMTFISVLRVISLWFPAGRVALVTQLTGILGQLGSVAAAYPLVAVLHGTSWQATFLGAAATGVVVAVLVLVALRDAPAGTGPAPAVGLAELR